ncbi:glycosyltransferase [candidate division KSB3 bacterium]|uniref:Glycosyltransferase n=1 Tax=candidate division KSB3 bacterium TaxID=2044937 RepID=A0A9D5Q6I8_9BACT|nr:glycosyltransferase [candidate division KSB3 bacterium]MBD3324961.1 glycosyltransferase [candidate division KSB3 bacterium]
MNVALSLIIPFLNEQENIPVLVSELTKYFAAFRVENPEVLFVDDGSTDHSVELLGKAHHQGYRAKLLKLSRNYGSHAALRAGIWHATGEYITFLPADLQDPVELIEALYAKAHEGYDIVWAARQKVDVAHLEKFFSKVYAKLMQRFVANNYPPNGFDVVMFNRKVQQELNQNIEANSSLFLQLLTLGFTCTSISYDKRARKAGTSKWTFSKKLKLFIDSFVAFSYMPIRFVSLMGITLAFIGLLWAFYIIGRTLILNDLTSGWPTLISVLMIGFGLTNISLGIIAEYLWRTLDASRARKVFIVDEVIDISPENSAVQPE